MLNYGFEFNDDYNHNFVWFYRGVYRFGCRGGGLISTPALLAIGLPPSVALGTNKLASSFGSLTSAIKFIRSGKVDLYVVAKLFGFCILASASWCIYCNDGSVTNIETFNHYCTFVGVYIHT